MRAAGGAAVFVVLLDEEGEGVGSFGRCFLHLGVWFQFVLSVLFRRNLDKILSNCLKQKFMNDHNKVVFVLGKPI